MYNLPSSSEELLKLLFFETHLYTPIEGLTMQTLRDLADSSANFDADCVHCKSHTIYSPDRWDTRVCDVDFKEELTESSKFYMLSVYCNRNSLHHVHALFFRSGNTIAKVGQCPSLADVQELGVKKYRRTLGNQRFRELCRAIGLAAHGVGCGSFVYLRRIFESLIEEAREKAKENASFDDSAFQSAHMDVKIQMLSDFLPSFLVEHRILYGIMSIGVHKLSDEECLANFEVVKFGIQMILDQRMAEEERQKKIEDASKAIMEAHQRLKT